MWAFFFDQDQFEEFTGSIVADFDRPRGPFRGFQKRHVYRRNQIGALCRLCPPAATPRTAPEGVGLPAEGVAAEHFAQDIAQIIYPAEARGPKRESALTGAALAEHVGEIKTVHIGAVEALAPRPSKSAILANAVALILCHNHPSGDLVPSDADLQLTRQIVAAGDLLGIKVLDHLIVSNAGYKSLTEIQKF